MEENVQFVFDYLHRNHVVAKLHMYYDLKTKHYKEAIIYN